MCCVWEYEVNIVTRMVDALDNGRCASSVLLPTSFLDEKT